MSMMRARQFFFSSPSGGNPDLRPQRPHPSESARLPAQNVFARLRYSGLITLALFLGVLGFTAGAAPVSAQIDRPSASLMTPATSRIDPEGALSVPLSPAAAAFVRSYAFTYLYTGAPSGTSMDRLGHGVYGVAKLPFGFALGASLERQRPLMFDHHSRYAFSLSHSIDPRFAMGMAVRRTSDAGVRPGVTSVDLGLIVRPIPLFGIALNIHDFFGRAALTGGAGIVETTFDGAISLRPIHRGRDYWTLEAGLIVNTAGIVGVRGLSLFEIPYVGQLNLGIESLDLGGFRDVRGSVGLIARIGTLSVGGSAHLGDGYDGAGHLILASLVGGPARTFPLGKKILDIHQDGSLDARALVSLLSSLELARMDDRVRGVFLRLRDTRLGVAGAEEIREAIERLEAAGKSVVCHLSAASLGEYYACASAKGRFVDPAGHLRLLGLSLESIHLARALEKLGVRAEFIRRGPYKSAPEMFTDERMSAPSREERERYLDEVFAHLRGGLAEDLERSESEIARIINEGLFSARDAAAMGLVDGEGDEYAFSSTLRRTLGRGRVVSKLEPRRPDEWAGGNRVAIIVIDDILVDGKNVDLPILNIRRSGAQTVIRALDRAVRDPRVRAIVLRIDSPGGSAIGSDQIWRAVMRARTKKPVVASLGPVATSGAYYIASAADVVFATPSALTGSIGVFFGKADGEALAEKIGVDIDPLERGEKARALSRFRALTDAEKEALRDKVDQAYALFIRRVAEGRQLEQSEVEVVAEGRILSGIRAFDHRLVDELGGFSKALARARQMARLRDDSPYTFAPRRPQTLLDYVLPGRDDAATRSLAELFPLAHHSVRLFLPLMMSRDGALLALPEETYLGP